MSKRFEKNKQNLKDLQKCTDEQQLKNHFACRMQKTVAGFLDMLLFRVVFLLTSVISGDLMRELHVFIKINFSSRHNVRMILIHLPQMDLCCLSLASCSCSMAHNWQKNSYSGLG